METSSRAFTNGPEGNLLLTLSDDNSSLQLRPKSVKNRIIPIITIITILANRQGALAALGEAHLFNYLEDVSISTSVPTKNKNKNKKKLRTISIVRYGKPWVMQRSAPNSSVVFIQVSRLILPEKKKKKKRDIGFISGNVYLLPRWLQSPMWHYLEQVLPTRPWGWVIKSNGCLMPCLMCRKFATWIAYPGNSIPFIIFNIFIIIVVVLFSSCWNAHVKMLTNKLYGGNE